MKTPAEFLASLPPTEREVLARSAKLVAGVIKGMSGDVIQLEAVSAKEKRSARFASLCWQQWARREDWPDKLDLYEAAAYLRVDYKSIWRACQTGRDRKAKLRHQRIGTAYRINRVDLDGFGAVEARKAAA